MPREDYAPNVSVDPGSGEQRSISAGSAHTNGSRRGEPVVRTPPSSWRFVMFAALGVGAVSFLATELMHYILVPDIGPSRERLLAEGLSALLVALLAAKVIQMTRQQHQLLLARMQVIAEMNHHIRNALSPLSLSLDDTQNKQLKTVIEDSVDRIDWALREILPRETPLGEQQRHALGYFQRRRTSLH
jgi:hypothetical protein